MLRWTASGDDGHNGQVSSYELRFHDVAPEGFDDASLLAWWDEAPPSRRSAWGQGLASAGKADSIRVNGLSPSTTYYFIIRARDEAGNVSDFSNVAIGTTAAACVGPASAPGGFTAALEDEAIVVSWNAIQDPAVQSFHLYRSTGTSGGWDLIHESDPSSVRYVDGDVSPGRTYRYRASWMGDVCEGPYTPARTVTIPGGTPAETSGGGQRIRAYPNPSTGPVTLEIHVGGSSPQNAQIRLFDVKGRWIAELASGVYPPGTTTLTWNRASRTGEVLGAGYYDLVGHIGNEKVRERLVLLP